jgi:hypothetical protein
MGPYGNGPKFFQISEDFQREPWGLAVVDKPEPFVGTGGNASLLPIF